jgi:hypothetical protein
MVRKSRFALPGSANREKGIAGLQIRRFALPGSANRENSTAR